MPVIRQMRHADTPRSTELYSASAEHTLRYTHSRGFTQANQFILHTISAANTSTLAGQAQHQIFPATAKLKANVPKVFTY